MKSFLLLIYPTRLVLFILLFSSTKILAQEHNPIEPMHLKRYILKTAPINFEELNIALEYPYKPERSYQFGFGYLHSVNVDAGGVGEPVSREVNGFSIKLSQRTYSEVGDFSGPQGSYQGPLFTYRYMAFPEEEIYLYFPGGMDTISKYKLYQQVASLQYLWGKQRIVWNWLVLDGFVGVGGRFKYAREEGGYPDRDMLGGILYGTRLFNGPDWVVKFGPSVSLNLAIGVVLK